MIYVTDCFHSHVQYQMRKKKRYCIKFYIGIGFTVGLLVFVLGSQFFIPTCPPWSGLWYASYILLCATPKVCVSLSHVYQLALGGVSVSPSRLIQVSVIMSVERCHFVVLAHLLYQCIRLSPSLPLSHSVTLLWRMWWKWLFNHAERSTNQRARAEWFKGLFRAQLEGEGKGGRQGGRRGEERDRRVGVWLLNGAGHLSCTYHWSRFTNNCPW